MLGNRKAQVARAASEVKDTCTGLVTKLDNKSFEIRSLTVNRASKIRLSNSTKLLHYFDGMTRHGIPPALFFHHSAASIVVQDKRFSLYQM
jgi:hypothetical protein